MNESQPQHMRSQPSAGNDNETNRAIIQQYSISWRNPFISFYLPYLLRTHIDTHIELNTSQWSIIQMNERNIPTEHHTTVHMTQEGEKKIKY